MKTIISAAAIVVGITASHPAVALDDPPAQFLKTTKVVPSGLPFSDAVRVGNTLDLSGQLGVLPGTTTLAPGGLHVEARQAMTNIKTSLEAHAYAMSDLVKCTVMLADMAEWTAFNEVYASFFDGHYPARSAFGANGLALDARVEIECIAARAK